MKNYKIYEKLMKKCFALAQKGSLNVLPNPLVGAIIYDEEKDEIISTGYHKKYGSSHAEVNAINSANGNTKNKTLIVNLEPCSHFGHTPPCADLIIQKGFKKVVLALVDPNPKVQGQGIKKLKDAGIEVITGVLEDEAKKLNRVFIKNITQKMPYIMLKSAITLDGKIALQNKKSKWITNEKSRLYNQTLRSSYQAIMSASGTILNDNPRLNVRIKNKKSPIRIIFDPNNKIPLDYNVFNDDGQRVILINNSKIKNLPSYIEKIEFDGSLGNLFKTLYEMKIYSIMIESGCGFNSLVFKEKQVDEINLFISNKIFGGGINFIDGFSFENPDDCIKLNDIKIKQIENNFLFNARVEK